MLDFNLSLPKHGVARINAIKQIALLLSAAVTNETDIVEGQDIDETVHAFMTKQLKSTEFPMFIGFVYGTEDIPEEFEQYEFMTLDKVADDILRLSRVMDITDLLALENDDVILRIARACKIEASKTDLNRAKIIGQLFDNMRDYETMFPTAETLLSYFGERYSFDKYSDSRRWSRLRGMLDMPTVVRDDKEIFINELQQALDYWPDEALAKFVALLDLESSARRANYFQHIAQLGPQEILRRLRNKKVISENAFLNFLKFEVSFTRILILIEEGWASFFEGETQHVLFAPEVPGAVAVEISEFVNVLYKSKNRPEGDEEEDDDEEDSRPVTRRAKVDPVEEDEDEDDEDLDDEDDSDSDEDDEEDEDDSDSDEDDEEDEDDSEDENSEKKDSSHIITPHDIYNALRLGEVEDDDEDDEDIQLSDLEYPVESYLAADLEVIREGLEMALRNGVLSSIHSRTVGQGRRYQLLELFFGFFAGGDDLIDYGEKLKAGFAKLDDGLRTNVRAESRIAILRAVMTEFVSGMELSTYSEEELIENINSVLEDAEGSEAFYRAVDKITRACREFGVGEFNLEDPEKLILVMPGDSNPKDRVLNDRDYAKLHLGFTSMKLATMSVNEIRAAVAEHKAMNSDVPIKVTNDNFREVIPMLNRQALIAELAERGYSDKSLKKLGAPRLGEIFLATMERLNPQH